MDMTLWEDKVVLIDLFWFLQQKTLEKNREKNQVNYNDFLEE